MWLPKKLERGRRGVGRDGLWADGVEIGTWLELARWDEPAVNLQSCEMCGGDCGGVFVAPRIASGRVLLLPPLAELADELTEERWPEHPCSPTVRSHGVMVFDEDVFRRVIPELPRVVPPLTRREVVRCLQLELDPLLGRFPAPPRADRARFIAGPTESLEGALDALDALLEEWSARHATVELAPDDGSEPLWFHADDRDVYPLARTPEGLRPRFEPGWVAR
ncbi:MAG: hypothetical protein SangKO_029270 [Sandaracinaceae bacterium]